MADGQRLQGPDWWGANRARCQALLSRAGITPHDSAPLVFPAGSIYWIKPRILERFATLPFGPGDFELEMGQVDGTTAHALERGIGMLVQSTGLEIVQASELEPQRR